MATKKKTTVKKPVTKKAPLNKAVAKKLKSKKAPTPLEKKLVIIVLIVSSVVVLLSLFIGFFFNPQRVAERKLKYLAKDYYENYYYDKFVATLDGSEKNTFEKYAEIGFSPVYLRQLLLFDNERDASFEKYFTTSNYTCDKNSTKVQFFPTEPYGKTDYKIVYTFSCNNE